LAFLPGECAWTCFEECFLDAWIQTVDHGVAAEPEWKSASRCAKKHDDMLPISIWHDKSALNYLLAQLASARNRSVKIVRLPGRILYRRHFFKRLCAELLHKAMLHHAACIARLGSGLQARL
jgi:hypothetical protein